jgi:Ca2+/Na+ antiporter
MSLILFSGLYLLGIFITLYFLSITVDKFLIPTIYIIKDKFKLTDDQTGALTSFVSSAPELSVSMISLFLAIQANDADKFREIATLGPSAVIGSALFSVLFIVGASSWYSTQSLTWHSVTRDMGYYIISVLALFWTLTDKIITPFESFFLLGMYLLYVLIVAFWPRISKLVGIQGTMIIDEIVEEKEEELEQIDAQKIKVKNAAVIILSKLFFKLKTGFNGPRVIWNVLFSVVLVVVSSYFMVDFAQELAVLWSVPAAIIGLTILAAGTSVPDLLASVKTAKEGYGNTAITNAIGSNVFDVLGNLGLTWVVASLVTGGKNIEVETSNLNGSIILLIASSSALLLVLIAKRFHIGKPIAVFLMTAYIVSVIILCLQSVNIL